jgi:hypothetical protein
MNDIPAKYAKECIAAKRVLVQNHIVTFILTPKYDFLEVRNQQIINFISLKTVLEENMVCTVSKDNVKLRVYHQDDDDSILLMIKVEKNLVVLSKTSEINVIKVCKDVSSLKIVGQSCSDIRMGVAVIVTYDDGSEEELSSINNLPHEGRGMMDKSFKAIENQLVIQKQKVLKSLQSIRNQQQLKLYSLRGDQKFLPRLMRLNVSLCTHNHTCAISRSSSYFQSGCQRYISFNSLWQHIHSRMQ